MPNSCKFSDPGHLDITVQAVTYTVSDTWMIVHNNQRGHLEAPEYGHNVIILFDYIETFISL